MVIKEASSSLIVPRRGWGRILAARERGRHQARQPKPRGYDHRRRKTGGKLRKRTWASAGRSQRARWRWGIIMSSVGRGRSAELMRGGGACQPGLTFANGVANGRQSFPLPPAGGAGLGVVRPKTDARTGSKSTRSQKGWLQPKKWCQCSIKVLFHDRVLCELGSSASKLYESLPSR